MTEADWLGHTSPDEMLSFLAARASDRSLRLFACVCCRRAWPSLPDERSRRAVEVAERFADGDARTGEVRAARGAARAAARAARGAARAAARAAPLQLRAVAVAAARCANPYVDAAVARRIAAVAAEQVERDTPGGSRHVRPTEVAAQAGLLRDLVGNPFRPAAPLRPWLPPEEELIRGLAWAIHEGRAFDRLPILGDALEEAGCADEALLGHCRQPAEHARGCWAVDLVLGGRPVRA
jgi:hypothetical protein